ncbi:MAG: prenyltransferase [Candidatus Bathyarchaeota archaeon]|nr:prenyltransferase [Candidatus Bathyarchaeota archaeon]
MSNSHAAFPKILKIIRIHIVAGGVLAFSLGALLAMANGGTFDPLRVILMYVVMLFGDLSAHYSNDYYDVEIDKRVEQKKFLGGSRLLVCYPELRPLSRSISVTLLTASSVLAVLIVLFYGAPVEFLVIAWAENFAGWSYSAPPMRLTSRGLGEVAVACVTGFAIPGIGYLAVRGQFDPLFLYLAVPFMMYGVILSLSLEAPDIEIDRKGGKTNLAVRKGLRAVFVIILAMAVSATLLFLGYAWQISAVVIDLRAPLLFSMVPLAAAFFGFVKVVFQKRKANLPSTGNVASLFVFNILMIVYLLSISFS